jgi:uncharacterized protein (TIGR03084 family)
VAGSEPVKSIVADLAAEHEALDAIVADLDEAAWSSQTPAQGWTVTDQIGHLTFFDEKAALAITDRETFGVELTDAAGDIDAYMKGHLRVARSSSPRDVLKRWRTERARLLTALTPLDPATRLPWYGPDMSARSFATARLMETWAHGQDVADALGAYREPTDRLGHIAFLGVRTIEWSFTINGLERPSETVCVELHAPSGSLWTWNEGTSRNLVRGSAEEFCLVVTQRRHVDDTELYVRGPVAKRWMEIAQAFAGPPGSGRAPGMFS